MIWLPKKMGAFRYRVCQTANTCETHRNQRQIGKPDQLTAIPVEPLSVLPITFSEPQQPPQPTNSQEEEDKGCSQDAKTGSSWTVDLARLMRPFTCLWCIKCTRLPIWMTSDWLRYRPGTRFCVSERWPPRLPLSVSPVYKCQNKEQKESLLIL